jgi:Holliday junction resolvasome RuvABC endonuclease subunit
MNTMYIGLDQSSSNTGVAYVSSEDKFKTIKYLTIKTSKFKRTETTDQFIYLLDEIKKVFNNYRLEHIFIESTYVSGMRGAIKLGKLEAVLMFYFQTNDIPYTVLSPRRKVENSWPDKVESQGTKDKFKEVLLNTGLLKKNKVNEHEVDAIGILIAGLRYKDILKEEFSYYKLYNANAVKNGTKKSRQYQTVYLHGVTARASKQAKRKTTIGPRPEPKN